MARLVLGSMPANCTLLDVQLVATAVWALSLPQKIASYVLFRSSLVARTLYLVPGVLLPK